MWWHKTHNSSIFWTRIILEMNKTRTSKKPTLPVPVTHLKFKNVCEILGGTNTNYFWSWNWPLCLHDRILEIQNERHWVNFVIVYMLFMWKYQLHISNLTVGPCVTQDFQYIHVHFHMKSTCTANVDITHQPMLVHDIVYIPEGITYWSLKI